MNILAHKQEFIKTLNGLDSSKSRWDNFNNFCEMSYCALAKATANEETAEKLEARYMRIIGTYENKDDRMNIANLFGIVTIALENGGCDFLGDIAGELELLDKRNGQFFTPYDISKLLAQISIMGADDLIQKDGFISVSDPAAGAGCTILAVADILEEQGHILHECMSVHVTELSKMTFYMLYIQLALRGIPAHVVHGDSLTMEVFESSYTPVSLVFVICVMKNKYGRGGLGV